MKRKRLYLTGLMVAACFSCAALTAWARHHASSVWAPDKTLLSKLADDPSPVSADYQIQAPPDWQPQTIGGPGKIGAEFDGPKDTNGNYPAVSVMVMGNPGWQQDKRTPADFVDLRIRNVKGMLNNWKQTKYESGTINGMSFARVHFTGTTMNSGNKVNGFMYCGRDGVYVIEIQGRVLADNTNQLPLLEAAAMTISKRIKPLV